MDSQVNEKGYRIELGEIEAHLKGFDGIKTAKLPWIESRTILEQTTVRYIISDWDVDVLEC